MAPPPPTLTSSRSSPSLPSSPHRAPALRPGSLQRLLRPQDPSDDSDSSSAAATSRSRSRSSRATLLQVTNITPALSSGADDPFSGHHGFYLRLSDSARSCYVSLHADHDDLILANGLHIGQIIEVDRLVPSAPAPVLRGFRVLPGRYPCVQQQDSGDDAAAAVKDKEVVSERPRRQSSPTPPLPESQRRARQGSSSPGAAVGHGHRSRSVTNLSEAGSPAARRRESMLKGMDSPKGLRKISVPSADGNSSDDDDDTSDVSSSYSSLSTARRNWDFSGSIKDVRPVAPRRRSNSISPGKSGSKTVAHQNGVVNDPLESVRRKAEKAFKVLSKRNSHASIKASRDSSYAATPMSQSQSPASSSGIKWCENNVIWSSLSSSLVRHGKEAMKQRDMALQAVLDGLLEASATEKLIKCLSKYSEIHSDKDDDPKEVIGRFLKFSQELDHAIFVAQSQARLRHPKACCPNSTSSAASPRAATKAALDRKQSAISWVRAAMEADLSSPFSSHTRGTSAESARASSVAELKPVSPRFCSKPKCNCNSSRFSKKTADASTEDGSLNAAMDLAVAMRSDGNRWFLKYIDKFLDDIESDYATCDSQVAGFLQQLKKVDDWLNRVVRHERMFSVDRSSKDSSVLSEEEESDACERVRRKIYGALLRHVQYAAMALEGINSVTDEEKELRPVARHTNKKEQIAE